MNSGFKLHFWRQRNAVCWSVNAEHWVCNLLLVVLFLQNHKDQRNLNRKLFYGSPVLMVYFFPWSDPQLPSVSAPLIMQGPPALTENHPGTILYSPITVVSIYYHIRFGSTGNSHVLLLFFLYLFCLPAVWECVVSVGFLVPSSFWGFRYPITVWQSVCRPPVVHRPCVEEHCSTSLTKASPKHKDFRQFSLPEDFFPQSVFSLHLPHIHIPLPLSLLLNFIRNNPLLGTNSLVWVLFHLSLVG